ncbi:MAG: FimV/HubP family polar landmark protein, partial [Gammaproteobacteria bacterium]
MKAFLMVVVLGLGLSLPTSAGFNEGVAAYSRGDYTSALREWYVSASQGEARAQYNIGVMHYKGIGTSRDLIAAARWIGAAAKQENGAAQLYLGVMYSLGEGVPQDLVKSHSWLDRAIMNLPEGPERTEAIRQRTFVESKLSPAQISEAQRIATTPASLEPAVASPGAPQFHALDTQPLPSVERSQAQAQDITPLHVALPNTLTAIPELAAIEQVRVRAYEHENFARIVFDWPQRVMYTTQLNRNRLLVSFSRPATFDLRAVNRHLASYTGPPEVGHDQALISFPLTDEFDVKTFALGSRVVIDLKRRLLVREYPPPSSTAGYATYTIKRGDTLWGISNRLRPGGVTINQMMLALLKHNPHAFLKKNVNRLEAGFTLQVPDRQETVSATPHEATREMARQEMAWRKTPRRKQPKPAPKQPEFEWADPSQPDPDFAVAPNEMPDVAETTASTAATEPPGEPVDTLHDRLAQMQRQVKTMQGLLAGNDKELERLRSRLAAKPQQQIDSAAHTPAHPQDEGSISFAALLTVDEQELVQLRNQLAMMLEDPSGSGNSTLMDANAAESISFAALL